MIKSLQLVAVRRRAERVWGAGMTGSLQGLALRDSPRFPSPRGSLFEKVTWRFMLEVLGFVKEG